MQASVQKRGSINKRTIAVYDRTATTDDAAIKRQRAYFAKYAKGQIAYYMDNGYSGLDYNRPAFSKLNRDISDGKVTQVIVRNLSRIGRDTIRTINWIKDIENQGVSVVIRDIPAELLETICTEVIA